MWIFIKQVVGVTLVSTHTHKNVKCKPKKQITRRWSSKTDYRDSQLMVLVLQCRTKWKEVSVRAHWETCAVCSVKLMWPYESKKHIPAAMAQDCDGVRKLQVQGHRPQGFGNSLSDWFQGFWIYCWGIADRLGIWGFGFVVIFYHLELEAFLWHWVGVQ